MYTCIEQSVFPSHNYHLPSGIPGTVILLMWLVSFVIPGTGVVSNLSEAEVE